MQETTTEKADTMGFVYWGYLESKDVLDANGRYVGALRGIVIDSNWTIPKVVIEANDDVLDELGVERSLLDVTLVELPSKYVHNGTDVTQLTESIEAMKGEAKLVIHGLNRKENRGEKMTDMKQIKEKIHQSEERATTKAKEAKERAKTNAHQAVERVKTNAHQASESAKGVMNDAKAVHDAKAPVNVQNEAKAKGEAAGAKVGKVAGVFDGFKSGFQKGMNSSKKQTQDEAVTQSSPETDVSGRRSD